MDDDYTRRLIDLDICLADARVVWEEKLRRKIADGGFGYMGDDAEDNATAKRHRLVLEETGFEIARFFYHLEARGISEGDGFADMMRAHNKMLEERISQPDYEARTGISTERLFEMMFSVDTIELAAMVVDRKKRPVINQNVLAAFLVTRIGKSRVHDCMAAFAELGLVELDSGPNNSRLISDVVKLTSAYDDYLSTILAGAEAIIASESGTAR